MTWWLRWCAAVAITAGLFVGASATAAPRHPKPLNPASAKLEKLPPAERDAELARAVGHWCIGTEAFLMGVIASGPGTGNAYWSLRCADGSAWAIQIDPLAEFTAIGCDDYKANAEGKECFKKF